MGPRSQGQSKQRSLKVSPAPLVLGPFAAERVGDGIARNECTGSSHVGFYCVHALSRTYGGDDSELFGAHREVCVDVRLELAARPGDSLGIIAGCFLPSEMKAWCNRPPTRRLPSASKNGRRRIILLLPSFRTAISS